MKNDVNVVEVLNNERVWTTESFYIQFVELGHATYFPDFQISLIFWGQCFVFCFEQVTLQFLSLNFTFS